MSPPTTLLAPLLALSALASAIPAISGVSASLPLHRKRTTATGEELLQAKQLHMEAVRNKYGVHDSTHARVKRATTASTGSVTLAGNDL